MLESFGQIDTLRVKTLPKLTPDILKRFIPEALTMKYGGMVYDERRACPRCSCEDSMRHDMKEKTFCTVITDKGFKDTRVGVKRFKWILLTLRVTC